MKAKTKEARAQTVDRTEYARSIGYEHEAKVMVSDGRVVSHGRIDWFHFCARCRRGEYKKHE